MATLPRRTQLATQPLAWPALIPLADRPSDKYLTGLGKRFLDVAVAAAAVVLLAPLMLVIALLIKLDSRGPVFFIQDRVGSTLLRVGRHTGYAPRRFRMYKFRSMQVQADGRMHEEFVREFINGGAEKSGEFKLSRDPRVTRLGRLLRKASLDELPQLFNVLNGEMSLVGPRPVPPYELALYQEAHYGRLAAKPGITGLWQVRGRCRVPFEQMVRMDIDYVQTASIWRDLRILLLTIPAVTSGRGAE